MRLPLVRRGGACHFARRQITMAAGFAATADEAEQRLGEFEAKWDDDYLPIIADCERAVGKHQAALRTLREARDLKLSLPQQVEAFEQRHAQQEIQNLEKEVVFKYKKIFEKYVKHVKIRGDQA